MSGKLAGAPGFEPGNGGIKIRCLTTWLRPNGSGPCRTTHGKGNPAAVKFPRRGGGAPRRDAWAIATVLTLKRAVPRKALALMAGRRYEAPSSAAVGNSECSAVW